MSSDRSAPAAKMHAMERMAVIDMGSNSFRLVIYSYERGGQWKLTDEIREAVRVSAGMGDERLLKPKPMKRAQHRCRVRRLLS